MSDRRVHARSFTPSLVEIVRYDRAGKWFREAPRELVPRVSLSVRAAAKNAVYLRDEKNGEIFFRLPGGSAFDRHVAFYSRRREDKDE